MEQLGQYQLQIFVSLMVILGAAFVALICDFLKGNNERLRELTIELRVRREEEQRHAQTMSARTAAPVKRAPAPASVEAPAQAEKRIAAAPPRRASAEALAAMERGARLAGAPRPKTAAAQPPTPPPQREVIPASPVTVAEKPAPARKDWGAILARRSQPATIETKPVVTEKPIEIPAGFHEGQVLSGLIQKHPPVTGLVVSIGVSTTSKTGAAVPEQVTSLVRSLIGPDDFACPSGPDEFLLIYPRLNGAAAQRQLSRVAQQLWDFQLRSLGSTSILFSWGGVEVAAESLDEAIASASERMQETRRGRKLITMPVRQAV
jgi:hypothetical protein